ncbi:MAG: hypothetical protein EOM44_14035 [Bacteroidia bacterium]|nr:hypothetical protein [Bacteroidia bacterium]
MKVKILKKTIKEGTTAAGREYQIKSLFVSFTEEDVYNKIVAHLKAMGASEDMVEKFCKPNEYNGNISYAFGLNCSHFTFDAVDKFGILDAKVVFAVNDNGYINARIAIIDKKEQVNSYDAPEDFVDGWACGNPEPKHEQGSDPLGSPVVIPNLTDLPKMEEEEENGLPF